MIKVLRLLKPKGLVGGVKCLSYLDSFSDLYKFQFYADGTGDCYTVRSHEKPKGDTVVVYFNGLQSVESVVDLIGKSRYLSIKRSDIEDIKEEDHFYQCDLIGCKVLSNTTNEVVGKVIEIYNFGHGDVLEVHFTDKKKDFMLPFEKEYFPVVNISDKILHIRHRYFIEI